MTTLPTRVAIVGGHGKIARLLLPLLLERGADVVSLARGREQLAALTSAGATARQLDIETSTESDFQLAFDGCDAVVFSAGGGADGNIARKRTVDLEGSLMSIAGAQGSGIARFVQVSAFGVDAPVRLNPSRTWKAYVDAKRDADAALRASKLDWTIVRPGGLTDDAGTGMVELAPDVRRGRIPRADVAAVIAAVLSRPDTVGHQWELVGGTTPIDAAIDTAVS